MPFDLVYFFWKRQKLVQAANGVETQVIDGKVEIENGNVPEDKPTEEPQNITISPFHIPRMYSLNVHYLVDMDGFLGVKHIWKQSRFFLIDISDTYIICVQL